jgi:hypothetical protein
MNHITQVDIDKAMEIINTPVVTNRGSVILNKSHYTYLCGMVRNMAKRISEPEKAAIVWHPYPAEKPTTGGRYLCLRSGGHHIWWWMGEAFQFDTNPTDDPMANGGQPQWWAELPTPPEVINE